MIIDVNERILTAEEDFYRKKWNEMVQNDLNMPKRVAYNKKLWKERKKQLIYVWNNRFGCLEHYYDLTRPSLPHFDPIPKGLLSSRKAIYSGSSTGR